jgi:hypothetical protein
MLLPGQHWYPSHHADPRAIALYLRHYSAKRYADGRARRQFCAPGEKMVLLTPEADALWVWHKAKPGMRLDGLEGVSCSVFRNESPHRSSDLILEAEALAWARWPGETLFTYVAPTKVASAVPGWCFMRARWKRVGESKGGLLLEQKQPKRSAG